jgi:YD repeat-containing protein
MSMSIHRESLFLLAYSRALGRTPAVIGRRALTVVSNRALSLIAPKLTEKKHLFNRRSLDFITILAVILYFSIMSSATYAATFSYNIQGLQVSTANSFQEALDKLSYQLSQIAPIGSTDRSLIEQSRALSPTGDSVVYTFKSKPFGFSFWNTNHFNGLLYSGPAVTKEPLEALPDEIVRKQLENHNQYPGYACEFLSVTINGPFSENSTLGSGYNYSAPITVNTGAGCSFRKESDLIAAKSVLGYITCNDSYLLGECKNKNPSAQKGAPPYLDCKTPTGYAGDPINTAIGNSFQYEIDYSSSGASGLNFSRAYNSLDGLWRHNHSTYLRLAGNNLALVMADGRESFFTISGSTVTAPPTELGRLTKAGDTWLYTAKNNDTYSFDATGRLTHWTNAAGAEHLLSYVNGSVTVTDNLGQTLSFTEDAEHQPLTLSTAGLTIKYDYNAAQRLVKLTRGGQTEQRLFHYEKADKPNLLTGITDERGVRFTTWTFDDQDRATSSEHAGGVEHTQITYNADGSSTVTNEFGKKSIYRFVTIDGVKRVSAIEGEALGSCPMSNSTFTYDERGLLKTKTDNKGFVTTYDYNDRGLEITRTEATGTAQARTTTTTWHATLNLPLTVTEPGRVTTYTYDAQGRQLSQTSASTAL